MNITWNGALQFLGFSIATLVATGALVLGGLNERGPASGSPTAVSQPSSHALDSDQPGAGSAHRY